MEPLAWFFDFHSHHGIRINHEPDVDGMAAVLAECGIRQITTFAKCHTGFAYYPSKAGTPHPRMRGDAFGDAVAACRRRDIEVMAYVSFGIDGEAGRRHHDWLQQPINPPLNDDWYLCVCPYTPYLDDLMLPMIAEVIDNYDIAGFFFDTMSALHRCECGYCQAAFREAHGGDIPATADDPLWAAYHQFRHRRATALIARVATFITDRQPGAGVGFNQFGTYRYPEPLPAGISHSTLDFSTWGPQSLQASMSSAYGATTGRTVDVLFTIFNQGWGDWTPRRNSGLEQTAVTVWARGGRPYCGDRLHPANRLDPISMRAMRFIAALRQQVAVQAPAATAVPQHDVLLLTSPEHVYGSDLSCFAGSRDGLQPIIGAHRLLLDSGASFTLTAECYAAALLPQVKLVVLPELTAIGKDANAMLEAYVRDGGKLLVIGQPPTCDQHVPAWLGISLQAAPWQDHIYLPAWPGDDVPVLVRGDYYVPLVAGADVVCQAIQPYDCSHGKRFGWGIGPASTSPSEHAILTRRSVGSGEVWHLAAPLCSDYLKQLNWTQFTWLRRLLDRLLPQRAAVVHSEFGNVEVVHSATPDSSWLFLVNHAGEQLVGGAGVVDEKPWARTVAPPPALPVTIAVQCPAGRRPKAVTANGETLPWQCTDGRVTAELVLDTFWRVIRLDWQA